MLSMPSKSFVVAVVVCFGFGVFFFPLLDLPLIITPPSAIHIFSLASHSTDEHLCFHLCTLCSCKIQSTFSALLSQMHVDVQFDGKCRTGADCLQMPISLPIVWGNQESQNNCVGCKANCWWFTFDCVRVFLCLSFSTSVGSRIQSADILKGVWSISSPEIVWALSFQTYCYLSLSVAETVLWGYNCISISEMYGFAFCFIF